MGQVSASSTVLIDAEPNRGGRSRGLRLVRPKILPRTTAATRCSRAGRCRHKWRHGSCWQKSVANQCCYLPVFMLTMYQ